MHCLSNGSSNRSTAVSCESVTSAMGSITAGIRGATGTPERSTRESGSRVLRGARGCLRDPRRTRFLPTMSSTESTADPSGDSMQINEYDERLLIVWAALLALAGVEVLLKWLGVGAE